MKIKCKREQLYTALSLVEKISGRNLTLPVLNCVLLDISSSGLKLRSTNLELGIEIDVSCKTDEKGIVAIPGSILLNTLSYNTSDDIVVLETDDNNLLVSTNMGKTIIKAYPHDDFPTIPRIEAVKSFSIKPDILLQGLRSVWYSASVSTIKPELGSVYIQGKDGTIIFAATDSFRLAEKTLSLEKVDSFDSFLIPVKSVPEIIRTLEHSEQNVEIHLNTNQIAFVFDKIYLTSRLIDGIFPDYKQIIPKENTTEVIVLKQDIITTLKKTTVFSDISNQIRFSINPSKKRFTLHSSNADVGETTDSIDGVLKGDALDISFNHRYISDCFQSIPTDSVVLLFGGLAKPMIIKGVGDNSFLYLVMPMNK